jgi:hydroxymethylpyrimidine/phosphomethylpyrimidine kinase
MKNVLTIAGFDPSSGAGVTADLKVFAAHGLFGTACITALTVQSTLGVMSTHPVDSAITTATLRCLHADIPPVGVKIGMIPDAVTSMTVSSYCKKLNLLHSDNAQIPIVMDTIIRSSSGRELIDPGGLCAIQNDLFPLVDWITPNLEELAVLSGTQISRRDDIPAACRNLQQRIQREQDRAPLGIVATSGHLDPPDDFMLTPAGEEIWFSGSHIETTSTHGTGCAFSSALLSRLVLGDSPREACRKAKAYVLGALKHENNIGLGHNPVNHLWTISAPID